MKKKKVFLPRKILILEKCSKNISLEHILYSIRLWNRDCRKWRKENNKASALDVRCNSRTREMSWGPPIWLLMKRTQKESWREEHCGKIFLKRRNESRRSYSQTSKTNFGRDGKNHRGRPRLQWMSQIIENQECN